MKRLIIKILFMFTFLTSITTPALAEQGWILNAKVIRIVVTSDGGINVRLSPELTACTSQRGYGPNFASVYPSHPGKKEILSVLMTAYTTDKLVSLFLGDNTCKVTDVRLGG